MWMFTQSTNNLNQTDVTEGVITTRRMKFRLAYNEPRINESSVILFSGRYEFETGLFLDCLFWGKKHFLMFYERKKAFWVNKNLLISVTHTLPRLIFAKGVRPCSVQFRPHYFLRHRRRIFSSDAKWNYIILPPKRSFFICKYFLIKRQ